MKKTISIEISNEFQFMCIIAATPPETVLQDFINEITIPPPATIPQLTPSRIGMLALDFVIGYADQRGDGYYRYTEEQVKLITDTDFKTKKLYENVRHLNDRERKEALAFHFERVMAEWESLKG